MLLVPISILAGATVVLAVVLVIVNQEQVKGKRIVLPRVRGWFDRICEALTRQVRRLVHVFVMSCAYVVHQLRAALAKAIAPRPRRPKKQRDRLQYEKTDNHLSSMHDHKSDTALTPAQKKKLRNQKLEERL